MARPSMSASVTSKHLTEEERKNKVETEQKLKGNGEKIKPPKHLSKEQKKIFKYIVNELVNSEILGNLDIYVLSTCSICIDRLQEIEKLINEDIEKLNDRKLMGSRKDYQSDLFRCMSELSMTPASRAKLGNLNLQAQQNKEDPVLKEIGGDNK
ncbi:phage terminase small subunit P27 family [Clostridium botulinum]|uniref:Phage terminase small subunit P27 family n=1 Tax=Clostridium botulinum TaxID=1491 RepID=A0A6B4JJE7_CLOBO|nr:phage terminase small subunit P27 family [Clostridium botulinum]EES50020.1 putative phage terminase, small subunit, P27 family [Clostridium botulinum E1 str. 'BoNT E Beluga']MBY6760507.1 phage terminase small subunit P27 family [Clostridium botulinum]MBY6919414.1 phage terminase small subunit P27 family [Clostridium botulinum]MCR1130292.1 phage terminase small subunit P27 family [Clostridium botulinum]NFJ56947.1 phage terminase small subunit P27 family [Clostridium botulinum]